MVSKVPEVVLLLSEQPTTTSAARDAAIKGLRRCAWLMVSLGCSAARDCANEKVGECSVYHVGLKPTDDTHEARKGNFYLNPIR